MSRERIPVFPIEWILIQNIRNLGKTNIDKEVLIRIRDYFKSYLTDELKNRKALESKIKAFYPKD